MSLPAPLHRPEPIGSQHLVAAFNCGAQALNGYLVRHALKNHQSGSAKTFVAASTGPRVEFTV